MKILNECDKVIKIQKSHKANLDCSNSEVHADHIIKNGNNRLSPIIVRKNSYSDCRMEE